MLKKISIFVFIFFYSTAIVFSADRWNINYDNSINRDANLNRGLVAWYMVLPNISGGGKLFDLKKRNDGTLTNGPLWYQPMLGYSGNGSLKFDGSNDYVDCGSSTDAQFTASAPHSIAFWVHPTASALQAAVTYAANGGQGWYIEPDNGSVIVVDGMLYDYFGPNGSYRRIFSSTSSVPKNKWTHILFTDLGTNASGMNFYINGQLDSSTKQDAGTPNDVNYSGLTLQLGARGGGAFFGGNLDDVRIYNRVLSASEAMNLYTASILGYPQELNQIKRRRNITQQASSVVAPVTDSIYNSTIYSSTIY